MPYRVSSVHIAYALAHGSTERYSYANCYTNAHAIGFAYAKSDTEAASNPAPASDALSVASQRLKS